MSQTSSVSLTSAYPSVCHGHIGCIIWTLIGSVWPRIVTASYCRVSSNVSRKQLPHFYQALPGSLEENQSAKFTACKWATISNRAQMRNEHV